MRGGGLQRLADPKLWRIPMVRSNESRSENGTLVEMMVRAAEKQCDLWHAADDRVYATVTINGAQRSFG